MKKQVQSRIIAAKKKNKRSWQVYQNNKKKILAKKISEERKSEQVSELFDLTKKKVKNNWGTYQKQKYTLTHKSDIFGLKIINRTKIKSGYIKDYKVKSLKGITSISRNTKELSKIRYVIVVLKIFAPDTEQTTYISDSFTPEAIEGLSGTEVQNLVLEKFKALGRYEGFEVRETSLKIIYKK